MSNSPGLLKLVILLASITRTMFWRKTKVTMVFLTTIYQVIHTLQQKQLDWVPILLQKFQLPLLAVILLYSPVGLTPLKNIH